MKLDLSRFAMKSSVLRRSSVLPATGRLAAAMILGAIFLAVFLATIASTAAEDDDLAIPCDAVLFRWPCVADRGLLPWMSNWLDMEEYEDCGKWNECELSDVSSFMSTESSVTVGWRQLYTESGYTYNHDGWNCTPSGIYGLPETLLRNDITDRREPPAAWNLETAIRREIHSDGQANQTAGGAVLKSGFKFALTKQDRWFPQTAVVVSAPSNASTSSNRQANTRIDYLYTWELNRKISLNCGVGNTLARDSGERLPAANPSAAAQYDFNKQIRNFDEWYVLFRLDSLDSRQRQYYDGGFTYFFTPNFQLDWRAGVGMSDTSDRFFTGWGLTVRR